MTVSKSYFVDPAVDRSIVGFICYCFLNHRQIDRRFFKEHERADDYGKEWLEDPYKMDA
jgi:hypothetical protein